MAMRGVRGATTVGGNEPAAIVGRTRELLGILVESNGIDPSDLASAVFTVTEDLDAEFPAVAAREIGLSRVPLMCAREIPVPGSLPKVVRVLVHCYPPVGVDPQHVYLGEARKLRLDLEGAQ